MTPLFSLAVAALLPWGYDAFVVLPSATSTIKARGGNPETTCKPLHATALSVDETIQQRKDARAALLDSGGVDKLMNMLGKLRKDSGFEFGDYEGAGAAAAVAAPPAPAAKKVCDEV